MHSILHAALGDAVRWNRVARNVADAANPPSIGSTRKGRRVVWTSDQLAQFLGHDTILLDPATVAILGRHRDEQTKLNEILGPAHCD